MKQKIFILDDDPDILRVAKDLLEDEGYGVTTAQEPKAGMEKLKNAPFDLIILDVRLPGANGFELCKQIKSDETLRKTPVIMFSVKSDVSDVVLGLEFGADDYIRKPFEEAELLARVKAVLRRKQPEQGIEAIQSGTLSIDFARYETILDGKPLKLTPKEFQLLGYFAKNAGLVLTRPGISQNVWGIEYNPSSKTIEFHVDQLRKKLGKKGSWIKVLKGVGYRFETDD